MSAPGIGPGRAVTHLSTNRARRRLTSLIETNTLPVHQTINNLQCHLPNVRATSLTLNMSCSFRRRPATEIFSDWYMWRFSVILASFTNITFYLLTNFVHAFSVASKKIVQFRSDSNQTGIGDGQTVDGGELCRHGRPGGTISQSHFTAAFRWTTSCRQYAFCLGSQPRVTDQPDGWCDGHRGESKPGQQGPDSRVDTHCVRWAERCHDP